MQTHSLPKSSSLLAGSLLAFIVAWGCAAPLQAAQRVALVIGNNAYRDLAPSMQLTSPVADATDVAAALKALGYVIITGQALTDASRDVITTATEKFAAESKGAEAAVFFYSGHGVQVGEDNYLLPTDTPKLTGMSMLKNRGVLLRDSIMVGLEEADVKTKVIILDCCRDNPFSAQLEAALSGIGKSVKTKSVGQITGYGPGFYLAFATSPGTTASDGNGQRNSPFTAAMLNAIPKSASKDIDFFFRDVKGKLGADQVSWTNHSLTDSFSLGTTTESAPVASSPPAGTADLEKLQREIAELKRRQEQLDAAPPPRDAPLDLPATGHFSLKEIYRDSPYASYNSHSQQEILRAAQIKLKQLGYYSGVADGHMGRGSQQAIIEWQAASSLRVTGRLNADSLSALGLNGRAQTYPPAAKPRQTSPSSVLSVPKSPVLTQPPPASSNLSPQEQEALRKLRGF